MLNSKKWQGQIGETVSLFLLSVSALETNRFDIESNIDGLLEMINKLGKVVSIVSNTIHLYADGKEIHLARQSNYVHLLVLRTWMKLITDL